MKIRKVSVVKMEISEFSKEKTSTVTVTVPWKERLRLLVFGKLKINVEKVPMLTFRVGGIKKL